MNYCNCKNPQPDEIEKGRFVCLTCNKEILDTREQPDYDDNEAEDFSECRDTVQNDQVGYEQARDEAQYPREERTW